MLSRVDPGSLAIVAAAASALAIHVEPFHLLSGQRKLNVLNILVFNGFCWGVTLIHDFIVAVIVAFLRQVVHETAVLLGHFPHVLYRLLYCVQAMLLQGQESPRCGEGYFCHRKAYFSEVILDRL